jgi:stress response protein YsnF
MEREERSDRFAAIEDRFADYEVYDPNAEKIGKVDDLFVDESAQPEYIGVKMGFLGTRSTLIPMEAASADDSAQRITVSAEKEHVKNGPTFNDDREITPEFEKEVYSYYGLQRATTTSSSSTEERGAYGTYYEEETETGTVGSGMTMGDTEHGYFEEHGPGQEGMSRNDDESDLHDKEDELRVQRIEEELRAGTRERQAGAVKVRKRVRTDRERTEVPIRRERSP